MSEQRETRAALGKARKSVDLTALAAFVCRQADLVYGQGQYVSGASRPVGGTIGLTPTDHAAIAMVGGALLQAGRPDAFASPHLLLRACTQPLAAWLEGVVEAEDGWRDLILLDADERVPTVDCRALADEFSGLVASEEEATFREFLAQIKQTFGSRGAIIYTAVREFVVRHPVVRYADATAFLLSIQAPQLASLLTSSIYQPIASATQSAMRRCQNCGSIVRETATPKCPLRQCRSKHRLSLSSAESTDGFLRASHSAMLYWVGPGLDEILVFDRLKAAGRQVSLYPDFDACDVELDGDVAIDLKSYITPFALMRKLNAGIGRLALYDRRIIGIGDELLAMNPDYIRQLVHGLRGELRLEVRSVSELLKEFGNA